MSGGTISGLGDLNETAGSFSWKGGTIGTTSGAGAVNVSAGAVLNVGTNSNSMTLSRVLNNSGSMSFTGGIVTFATGTINNQSGGVVNFATPPGSYAPYQINNGTSSFNNFGTMNVNTGSLIGGQSFSTLILNGGLNDSGTIIVNAGTLMIGNGSYTYGPGAVIKGTSTIDFGKGTATQTVNGNLTLAGSNMIIDTGTFTGPGNIDVTGSLTWNGGTFMGTGTMAVAAGGAMGVSSFTTHTLSRALSNSGVVNFTQGSIALNSGGFVNTSSGVVNILGSPQLVQYTPFSGFTGTAQFNNAGLMNINVGSNTGVQLAGPFVDSGTIAVNSGSVSFTPGSYTWNGAATVMGSGTISFTNSHTVNGNLTLAGSNMILPIGGMFAGPGNIAITGTLAWSGGTFGTQFGPTGTVTIASTGVVNGGTTTFRTLSGTLSNSGVYNSGNGSIGLFNGTFINAAGGTANFNSTLSSTQNAYLQSGTSLFNNSGQMNVNVGSLTTLQLPGLFTDYGTISVNSGTLAFNSGTYSWNGAAVINGSSTVELGSSFNTHIVNTTLTLAGTKISMGNGSFSGPGNENVTGVFNWNGGSFGGTGAMNVALGAINFGQASVSRILSQTLNNSGTATFTNASLSLSNGTFNNGATGYMNIFTPGTATVFTVGGSASNLLKNAGTVAMGAGSLTIRVPFINTGSVSVIANGAINTTAAFTNVGTIDLSGILTVGYSGPTVLPTIEQQIISGFNGGI